MMPYERIKAWEKCHELLLALYQVSKQWPREETYGLIAQARRAAFSAAANIVEGSVVLHLSCCSRLANDPDRAAESPGEPERVSGQAHMATVSVHKEEGPALAGPTSLTSPTSPTSPT